MTPLFAAIPIELLVSLGVALAAIFVIGFVVLIAKIYQKAGPEVAIVRAGWGGLKAVSGEGIIVFPFFHMVQRMDLSVKRIEIHRRGEAGLVCKDNIRADIEVAFFVRVNKLTEDILMVAQSLGCERASERAALVELFDAKFSEGLKTVGKHFNFVELYEERDRFKEQILKVIGTDLNGYVLDDCAIDYLEQTPLEMHNMHNILDAEGIKKITELTAKEHIRANEITREKQKVIKKQDVEAREAILALERQQIEAEQKQQREIAEVTAREQAQAAKVQQEERLKAENARISTEEQVNVAEQNKDRQIIVAMKSKERTEKVETERVEKDRQLEVVDRERFVELAVIDKNKAVEVEKRNIQEVIRERVMVERTVVEEQQRIMDTEQFATADRAKRVEVTLAEKDAQEALVKQVTAAKAAKLAAELQAEQIVIEAEAQRASAEKEMAATKMLAEAKSADHAAIGLAEATVMEAKAVSTEKYGTAEANVHQRKATAEAKGVEAMAVAIEKKGTAEATVLELKFSADASGIQKKAEAMKLFDGVGREHEEFKLKLNKDKDIEIAAIDAQEEIAKAQAGIVGEALKSARIDIVGGETTFFDKIVDSIKGGKAVDRFVHNSEVLTDVKNTFFNGNPEYFSQKLEGLIEQFNLSTDDVKDLSIAALIGRMLSLTSSDETRGELQRLLGMAKDAGLSGKRMKALKAPAAEKE